MDRYPIKEGPTNFQSKVTTTGGGIQYLRELTVVEVYDKQVSNKPCEIPCTWPMWWKFVWSAPTLYTNNLAVMSWRDSKAPTVVELASQLENSKRISLPPWVSVVEKLFQQLSQQLKKDKSSSPIVTNILSIKSQPFCVQGEVYQWHTPHATLWFYLPCTGGGHKEVGWWTYLETRSSSIRSARKNSSKKASIQENYCPSVCWCLVAG